jgi:hypothetical protein
MTARELADLVEEQHSVVGKCAERLPEARKEGAGVAQWRDLRKHPRAPRRDGTRLGASRWVGGCVSVSADHLMPS